MFCTEADTFITQCEKNAGNVDVVAATSHYALDCLGNALLGKPFGAQTGSFRETYEAYLHVMQMLGDPLGNFFPWIYKYPLPRNIKVRNCVGVMKNLLQYVTNHSVFLLQVIWMELSCIIEELLTRIWQPVREERELSMRMGHSRCWIVSLTHLRSIPTFQ